MPEWKQIIREKLAGLDLDPRREADIVEELAQDLEDRFREAVARGSNEAEARAAALAELHDSQLLAHEIHRAEQTRARPESLAGTTPGIAASSNWLADLWHDLRFGLRMLARNPGFAAVAIITLALGIGANTATFSVVRGVLLRPLAYPDSGRLAVFIHQQEPYGEAPQLAYLDFADIRQQSRDFENMAAILIDQFVALRGEEPVRIDGLRVTSSFFATMGAPPVLGRAFSADEEQAGKDRVAVISDRFWRAHFAGSHAAIGSPLTLEGQAYTVVGVLPPDFDFRMPLSSSFSIGNVDIYVPLGPSSGYAQNRAVFTFETIGRLKPGVSWTQAQSSLDTVAARLQSAYPDTNTGRRYRLIPLQEQVVGGIRRALLVLLAAAGLVLLIACANLGSLLLARATARHKELSVREALGASRGRILRQLIAESLLISILGGTAGVLLAVWVRNALVRLPDVEIPRLGEIAVDSTVLLFAAALALATALICSLAPLAGLRGADVQSGLRFNTRSTGGPFTARLRSVLVASEVAVACILLVGSALLLSSLMAVLRTPTGFDTERVLTLRVALTQQRYKTWREVTATFHELASQIEALPGVEHVGLSGSLPLTGHNVGSSLWIEGRVLAARQQAPSVRWQYVFPGYFRSMGIPLLRGRDFTVADQERTAHQTIISESLARANFPGEDPIGKLVYYGTQQEKPEWHEVIGVVGDVRHGSLEEVPVPRAYDLFGQHRGLALFMTVRTAQDPAAVAASVRHVLRKLDPEAPVYRVATMENLIDRSVAPRKYLSLLVGCFAALAFVLAVVGIHGVLAYNVERRTPEIGVRIALGATRSDVLGMVLREGMMLTLAGIAAGVVASLALGRFLQSLLYGVAPTDLRIYVLVGIVLMAVALLACWVPARRAVRVDPMMALRHE